MDPSSDEEFNLFTIIVDDSENLCGIRFTGESVSKSMIDECIELAVARSRLMLGLL